MIIIKTPEQIEKMRVTCRLAAETLDMIAPHIKPGVSTETLNTICHDFIVRNHAIPAPLNYRGFPKSICTSVNHQVCHGIPSDRVLRDGDIINVDITTIVDGWHGDTSRTFQVGTPTKKGLKIAEIAKKCLDLGIAAVRPGIHLGDIGAIIEDYARQNRCTVVREYCGHGIGEKFHEEPAVLHFGNYGEGVKLLPGMIFTIEPMVNLGKPYIKLMPDQWTVVTKDHSLSAQYEHTVLVTESGHDVLTDINGEYPPC
ncbi:methionine aminopeptidase, type I [Magnetococcus marinus MC-1]|uniref:Methionine aminopeptidase n=1 Tax=Magnetococcus marinus (strain ATCC BAA-1437 / JCM 17883 / MC-1) TaxID=156889 RepID=A0LC20_MAGMM|nr:type I methionyl aminopeptidase [Magnetococcus marinus]ABK45513.1 methionine aminopeptidase, type I [Magnetococcus marinus MC-1]